MSVVLVVVTNVKSLGVSVAVAKSLPPVDKFFMQVCPICGTPQRMMIRGLYVENGKSQLYPDTGYSFCNCRNIFFTKWENITAEAPNMYSDNYIQEYGSRLNSLQFPLMHLGGLFNHCNVGEILIITMRDPYFVIWTRPHEYTGFNPRTNYILWDMGSFVEECKKVGFTVISADRDMNVESKTPECYHITLRKS